MNVTISLTGSVANELQVQAAGENLSVEEFAAKMLSDVVVRRARTGSLREKNHRRVSLIQKSHRETLNQDEQRELQNFKRNWIDNSRTGIVVC